MGLSCLDPTGCYPTMREARHPLLKLHPKNTTFAESRKQVDPTESRGRKQNHSRYLLGLGLLS